MPRMFEEDDKSEPGDPEWRDDRPNLNFWENEESSDTFTEAEHQHIPAVGGRGSSFSWEKFLLTLFWIGLFIVVVLILFVFAFSPH